MIRARRLSKRFGAKRVTSTDWTSQYFWMPWAPWRTPIPDSRDPPNGSSVAP